MPRDLGVLAARSICKSFGDTVVLDRISLTVTPGSKVGVVGPNGIGKSTLLRVLAGLDAPDSGTVIREPPGMAVAYLPQEAEIAGRSGGEAARARLEAILSSDADVLLLDEPTNDLDFAGLELLERFLDRHRGALVVVSHDRALLEGMTQIIEFEAETRTVRRFAGGWSEFEAERARARERHEAEYGRYVDERARIREQARKMRQWEERGYGQGRKKKKTKDIAKRFEKKLAQVERVEKPWVPWRLELALVPGRRSGDVVARLEGAVVERGRFTLGPDRPRGSKRRPAGRARSKRRGQDDALASASRRAPAGGGRALDRTRRRPRRPPARRRSVLRGALAPRSLPRGVEPGRGRGANAPREVRARRRSRPTACALPLAGRAEPCDTRAPGRARRERARPR